MRRLETLGLAGSVAVAIACTPAPSSAQSDGSADASAYVVLGVAFAGHLAIVLAQIGHAENHQLMPVEGAILELVVGIADVIIGAIFSGFALNPGAASFREPGLAIAAPFYLTGGWFVGHGIASLTRPGHVDPGEVTITIGPTTSGLVGGLAASF